MSKPAALPHPDSSVVRAMDIGWGFSKFSVFRDGKLEFIAIPSLAPRHSGLDLSGSVMGKRDTVVVAVEGTKYEVGPDSTDLDSNDSTRNLSENYVYSDQYKAVLLGSLWYMGDEQIDLLMMGLPISHMHLAPQVKKLAIGKHEVGGRVIEVSNVEVLPQPVGGLKYCFGLKHIEGFEYLQEDMNLVIDPGFLTYDWLVSNGDRPIDTRSGAHTGGVSKVLRAMADSISAEYELKFENLSAIDRGLRRNLLKINGKKVELEKHIMAAKSVVEGSVGYMRNIVGSGADIDNIVMVGGGSFIFKKTVAAAFPEHTLLIAPEAQFANVMGYYDAGLDLVKAG